LNSKETLDFMGICYKLCYKLCYKRGHGASMKHVQHARGKWKVRITVPVELRGIIGASELVESDLPSDVRTAVRNWSTVAAG
jgi:hypothetical protein